MTDSGQRLGRTRWVLAHWSQGAGMHVLLAVLLGQQVLRPLLASLNQPGLYQLLNVALVPAALLAADYRRRGVLIGLTVLLVATVGTRVGEDPSRTRHLVAGGLGMTLTGVLLWVTLGWIRRNPALRLASVSAALCGYLLLGMGFATAYDVVDVSTEATTISGVATWEEVQAVPDPDARHLLALERQMDLSYYSFVTLTTLGYGDLTPRTPWTRSLATLEALLGQLYMVVLVAGLVGLHIAARDPAQEGEPR